MSSPVYTEAFLADDRRQPAVIGMSVVTALSFVIVSVRIYARGFLIRELGWDDYLIVLAQLISWVTLALSLMVIESGSGQHLAALMSNPERLVQMYKWLVAAQLVYTFNLWICRASGLAFYARLNPMPRFVLYLRISFAFITAVYIAQTLIIALQCVPLSALWGATKGKCMGSEAVFISTSVLTIVCDSLVLLLPINIVVSLQANLARKIALLIVLCVGIFAVVSSVLRMVSMIVALHHESDATWYFSVVIAWSLAEVSAAIIALSLPALRAFFGVLRDKGRSTDQSNSYSSGSGTIGLRSIPRSTRQRIYDGPDIYENIVDINCDRSVSQEALCGKSNLNDKKIRVMETVHVNVNRSIDSK